MYSQTRDEFFTQLGQGLYRLPQEDKQRFLAYYVEILEDYLENGSTEQEALEKMGSPQDIAREIQEELRASQDPEPVPAPPARHSRFSPMRIVILASLPFWGTLLLCAATFLMCLILVIWCLPLVTAAFTLAGTLTGIVSLIGAPMLLSGSAPVGVIQLGMGLALLGLALLMGVAAVQSTWGCARLTKRLVNWALQQLNRLKEVWKC